MKMYLLPLTTFLKKGLKNAVCHLGMMMIAGVLGMTSLSGCSDSDTIDDPMTREVTISNLPVIDGSDSTDPLRFILMCHVLGFQYSWERPGDVFVEFGHAKKEIIPNYTCTDEEKKHIEQCMKKSNTHGSFVNLIDNTVELVIAARSASRDENVYAQEKGVALIEQPIARDALTFMVNNDNPVNSLTTQQIQDIYTGKISNWKEVGGNDEEIVPYIRNRNSGSQEKFETMIMKDLIIKDFPEWHVGFTMVTPYFQIEEDKKGLAFTPFYYYNVIIDTHSTKALAVNGVPMTKENVRNNTYPHVSDIYAAVRADIDKNSMAYKLFEYLTTPAGQRVVAESGYIPVW